MKNAKTNATLACWKVLILAFVLIVPATFARATSHPTDRGFVDKIFRDESGEHKYVVFVPHDYAPDRKWPVILFLHGASARGNDGRMQTVKGLGPYVKKNAETFPFIAVFPQCENVKGQIRNEWSLHSSDGRRAIAILDEVERQFNIDSTRQILTGYSQGAYGAWTLAAALPHRWSCIVPVAGGGNPDWALTLKDVPVWAFHGASDRVVRPSEAGRMIEAIKAVGGTPRYTELPRVGHDSWKIAYGTDELYDWMLNPRKSETLDVPLRLQTDDSASLKSALDAQQPFVPAVIVPQAAYVRLGNDALRTLAESIPKTISRDALSGRLDDFSDTTTSAGKTYRVDMTRIRYDAHLTRAQIQAKGRDLLNIRLGIEDTKITIGNTFATGGNRTANAGPMKVVLGHRRPIWLNMDVTPIVESNRLRLELVDASFKIPNDNWFVTSPASVSTRRSGLLGTMNPRNGLRVVRDRVSTELVKGIYGSKPQIESQVKALIPSLIGRFEEELTFDDLAKVLGGIWPFPVYKPNVRVWPEEIATDENGVSIVMSLAAEAVDPRLESDSPKFAEPVGLSAKDVPRTSSLQLGIAPNLLHAMSDLLVQADVGRVHLVDLPGRAFVPMTVPQTLADVIPDLKRHGDEVLVRAELVLASPLSVVNAPESTRESSDVATVPPEQIALGLTSAVTAFAATNLNDGFEEVATEIDVDTPMFQFQFPRMKINYAIKTDPSSPTWTPYAEFEIQLAQNANAKMYKSDLDDPNVRLDWLGEAYVRASGRFAPDYQPNDPKIDTTELERLFANGWQDWTQSGPLSQAAIPDIDLGMTKLRISAIDWASPYLNATFKPAGIEISNNHERR